MALTFTLTRSFKIPGDENIGIATGGLKADFEFGSIEEAHGYFQEKDTPVRAMFGFSIGDRVDFGTAQPEQTPAEGAAEPVKRRGRPAKVEAVAPPPLPVPAAAPPALVPTALPPNTFTSGVDTTPNANGVPAFLDATVKAPPLAPLPPTPPTPPPVGLLGPKVVAALEKHKAGNVAVDPVGQVLSDWLAAAGLTIQGASFDEACRAVLMTSDEKLKGVAEAFGVQ